MMGTPPEMTTYTNDSGTERIRSGHILSETFENITSLKKLFDLAMFCCVCFYTWQGGGGGDFAL